MTMIASEFLASEGWESNVAAKSGTLEASPAALLAADSVAGRVSGRAAQVRRAFVVGSEGEPPPVARMLRGGRGGSVRLKLYLSLLWFAANPPYDVTYPARAWAQLLDLPDPDVSGARRVTDALTWLKKESFIEVQPRPGLPSRVVLLEESGTGRPYVVPGAAWRTLGPQASEDERQRNRYLQLPPELWTSGWLQILDGASIAMLLVILAESSSERANARVWFSPAEALKRYGLSPSTRTKGLSQLSKAGLVTTEKASISRDPFDLRRTRNAYRPHLDRLKDLARLDLATP